MMLSVFDDMLIFYLFDAISRLHITFAASRGCDSISVWPPLSLMVSFALIRGASCCWNVAVIIWSVPLCAQ
jgi:hypothetical protein